MLDEASKQSYSQIIDNLTRQISTCKELELTMTHLGDVQAATSFKTLGQSFEKDLVLVNATRASGMPPPPFAYRTQKIQMEM